MRLRQQHHRHLLATHSPLMGAHLAKSLRRSSILVSCSEKPRRPRFLFPSTLTCTETILLSSLTTSRGVSMMTTLDGRGQISPHHRDDSRGLLSHRILLRKKTNPRIIIPRVLCRSSNLFMKLRPEPSFRITPTWSRNLKNIKMRHLGGLK